MDTSWMSDVEATSGSNQAIGKCCVFLVYPLPFLRFVSHFFVTFFRCIFFGDSFYSIRTMFVTRGMMPMINRFPKFVKAQIKSSRLLVSLGLYLPSLAFCFSQHTWLMRVAL